MTKLEKLFQKHERAVQEMKDLKEEVAKLEAEKDRLKNEAEKAAKEGNVALYQEKRNEAQTAEDTLFVRRKQIKQKSAPAPKEEAVEAWKEYAGEYNKAFEKAWAEYKRQRKNLFDTYMKLALQQQEALRKRKMCAEDCAGIENKAVFGQCSYENIFPLSMIEEERSNHGSPKPPIILPVLTAPEGNFFYEAGLANPDDLVLLNNVIHFHTP